MIIMVILWSLTLFYTTCRGINAMLMDLLLVLHTPIEYSSELELVLNVISVLIALGLYLIPIYVLGGKKREDHT